MKIAILSRRPILLVILLYEQFLHLTLINLHPNTQLLSTQQHTRAFLIGEPLTSIILFQDLTIPQPVVEDEDALSLVDMESRETVMDVSET